MPREGSREYDILWKGDHVCLVKVNGGSYYHHGNQWVPGEIRIGHTGDPLGRGHMGGLTHGLLRKALGIDRRLLEINRSTPLTKKRIEQYTDRAILVDRLYVQAREEIRAAVDETGTYQGRVSKAKDAVAAAERALLEAARSGMSALVLTAADHLRQADAALAADNQEPVSFEAVIAKYRAMVEDAWVASGGASQESSVQDLSRGAS